MRHAVDVEQLARCQHALKRIAVDWQHRRRRTCGDDHVFCRDAFAGSLHRQRVDKTRLSAEQMDVGVGNERFHSVAQLLDHRAFALHHGGKIEREGDILDSESLSLRKIAHHSGGAAEGELWNQIKADIYQTEVKTIEENESAVLGSALLGGTAAGLYKNVLEKARELLKVKKVYYPNESQKKMYEEHFDIYKEMHDALQTSFEHLGQIER